VIVFSDHGEEFLEHGGLLHEKLYQETLRVPLIFYWAGRIPTGVEVEAQVPLMDLTPTLLDLVSIEKPVESNARSLLPLLEGGERSKSRLVYSEAPWIYRKPYQRSFRNLTHMLYDHGRHHVELFRTGIDPLELEDQSAVMPHLASALYRELEAYLENKSPLPEGSPETARELSDEEIEALKALGYVR